MEVGLEEEVPAEVDLLLHPPNTDQVQTTIRVRQNRHHHRHPRPTNIQAGNVLISQILNIFNSTLISRKKNFIVPKDHHQVCHK